MGKFQSEATNFNERFKSEGPATVGSDLDKGDPLSLSRYPLISCHCHVAAGMELLEEFKKEYATMEQHRQELTNAEKLFDLPITTYPDVMEVEREIRNMSKVYELHQAQKVSSDIKFSPCMYNFQFLCLKIKNCSHKNFMLNLFFVVQVAREEWASTLWANLDIVKLTSGIDEFMKRLRKLPKEVKALSICNVLEENMREFKDSIPLFADLKNDALRDR